MSSIPKKNSEDFIPIFYCRAKGLLIFTRHRRAPCHLDCVCWAGAREPLPRWLLLTAPPTKNNKFLMKSRLLFKTNPLLIFKITFFFFVERKKIGLAHSFFTQPLIWPCIVSIHTIPHYIMSRIMFSIRAYFLIVTIIRRLYSAFNVNGIRRCVRKCGFGSLRLFLDALPADIVCLQARSDVIIMIILYIIIMIIYHIQYVIYIIYYKWCDLSLYPNFSWGGDGVCTWSLIIIINHAHWPIVYIHPWWKGMWRAPQSCQATGCFFIAHKSTPSPPPRGLVEIPSGYTNFLSGKQRRDNQPRFFS